MIAKVSAIGLSGIEAYKITVEADVERGLPVFDIVGLPGPAVKEATNRIRAAMHNSALEFPKSRVVINLAPANIQKDSPSLDLAIFAAVCAACEYIPMPDEHSAFVGELSLSGEVNFSSGILAYCAGAKALGIDKLYIPISQVEQAAVIASTEYYGVENVSALVEHLNGRKTIAPILSSEIKIDTSVYDRLPDFSEVRGQYKVKRAMEIAAAGGHNMIMVGPPGSGKSMLAKRFPYILPPLDTKRALEVTKIWSLAGLAKNSLIVSPPFRSPHHTVSTVGMSGGGKNPRPGEISLANGGVLFLDELPEFTKSALEILRQPLEDKNVTISRASGTSTFPADFILIAAMNPCKCGTPGGVCSCSDKDRKNYISSISGPLLDRIDMCVKVLPLPLYELEKEGDKEESSANIRARVIYARNVQKNRLEKYGLQLNSQMNHDIIMKECKLTGKAHMLLTEAFEKLHLTARSYDRILKTARTLADLCHKKDIDSDVLSEILAYRAIDRASLTSG